MDRAYHEEVNMPEWRDICARRAWDTEPPFLPHRSLVRQYGGEFALDDVLSAVSELSGVPLAALRGDRRSRYEALPRHVAIYLMCVHCAASSGVIGRYLGDRNHTTILYARNKIADILEAPANHPDHQYVVNLVARVESHLGAS